MADPLTADQKVRDWLAHVVDDWPPIIWIPFLPVFFVVVVLIMLLAPQRVSERWLP